MQKAQIRSEIKRLQALLDEREDAANDADTTNKPQPGTLKMQLAKGKVITIIVSDKSH